ncbi:15585_t:CDS:2 [Acaulospora colombiana]|uniref:15585_t:CDS:1 n=1 Tax=Acaulospora colombiana TaxID=27376 RepID=A0ACA9N9C0_9GLOM|nr:15585_t:CDS:2 [Acaulospora colombiana]
MRSIANGNSGIVKGDCWRKIYESVSNKRMDDELRERRRIKSIKGKNVPRGAHSVCLGDGAYFLRSFLGRENDVDGTTYKNRERGDITYSTDGRHDQEGAAKMRESIGTALSSLTSPGATRPIE